MVDPKSVVRFSNPIVLVTWSSPITPISLQLLAIIILVIFIIVNIANILVAPSPH